MCSGLGRVNSAFHLSKGRCVEIPPLFSGLLRLHLSSLLISGHGTLKKAVGERENVGKTSQIIQNEVYVGKLRGKSCFFWRRKSEVNVCLQILKVFLMKKIIVQLYSVPTKHKTRGKWLLFLLDTLHGDRVLKCYPGISQ